MKKYASLSKMSLLLTTASMALSGTAMSGELTIEEVVVTAQKRSENLQDVPVSIAALTATDIEKQRLLTVNDIAVMVPNLQVYLPFGDGGPPIFTLRGVTASDYSQNQGRPIAMYIDEAYRGSGALEAVQLYDLERVEVLRGPQGTLYGKNATGGAVNLVTRKAGFDTEGYLTAGAGNFGRFEARGALQGALIDDVLAARVAFTFAKTNGYVKNVFPGAPDQSETDMYGVRLSVLYTPSANFKANLRVQKGVSKGENTGVLAGGIDSAFLGVDRTGLDFHENNSNFQAERRIENFGVGLTMDWDVTESYTLTSITAYDDGEWFSPEDDDGLPIRLDENEFSAPKVEQFTQELRISSNLDGRFNWIIGGFWGWDTVDVINILRLWNEPSLGLDFGLGGFGFNERNSFSQTRKSIAGFFHSTFDLTDSLTLTLGIRYTDDETRVNDYSAAIGGTPDGSLVANFDIVTISNAPTIQRDDNNTSFKVGMDWAVSEDSMIYASFSQGYRGGAINAQAFLDISEITTVEPEKLDAYEIGLKSQLFDNRVQLNAAMFYYDYKNQQFLDVAAGGLQVLRNAEKSRVLGFEVETTIRASERLNIRAGIGYLDPEYKALTLAGIDFSGNQLIGAAKWNINVAADLVLTETEWGDVTFYADTNYVGKTFFDAANNPALSQDGYWLANARLALNADDNSYVIALWAKNIFDKEYVTFGFDTAAFGLGFDFLTRGLPRTFGAELTYRF